MDMQMEMAFNFTSRDTFVSQQPNWSGLPAELYLCIMEHCDFPQQVQSFISADPLALSAYIEHRNIVLQAIEARMFARAIRENLSPIALVAVRLRHLRDKAYTYRPSDYRVQVERILKGINAEQARKSLALLIELSELIFDAERLMSEYISHIPTQLEFDHPTYATGYGSYMHTPPWVPSPAELTKFYRAIFRLEIFSCASFRTENVVYEYNVGAGPFFASSYMTEAPESTKQEITEFYSMLRFVAERYSNLFNKITTYLKSGPYYGGFRPMTENVAQTWGTLLGNPYENMNPTEAGYLIDRVRTRAFTDWENYMDWLCSQGIKVLRGVEVLGFQSQVQYILHTFAQISERRKIVIELGEDFWNERTLLDLFDFPGRICRLPSTDPLGFRLFPQNLDEWPFWDQERLMDVIRNRRQW